MDPPFEHAFDDHEPLRLYTRMRNAYVQGDASLIRDLTFHVRDLKSERDVYKAEIQSLKRSLEQVGEQNGLAEEPAAKKRKLPIGSSVASSQNDGQRANLAASWQQYQVAFEAGDISFSLPMRKKLKLQLVEGNSAGGGGIRVKMPSEGDEDVIMPWTDIEQIICVPVPEKMQASSQFIVLPKTSAPRSAIMWATPHTPPKPNTIALNKPYPTSATDSLEVLLLAVLNQHLAPLSKSVICPDPAEFSSSLIQAHRKGEKAYHVKAFRGSKEGFLYFLPTGVLFAPRAPLLYFPFHSITSISYSSVLQRTFNLNIAARGVGVNPSAGASDGASQPEEAETEFEFAMLDQSDFAGIDAYVKKHGLNDASLAAHRRAKVYNVNSTAKAGATSSQDATDGVEKPAAGNAAATNGEAGESELAKAERELQDAEDEEEEDYDPSGGESEGSGSDTEEEDERGREGDEYADDADEVSGEEEVDDNR